MLRPRPLSGAFAVAVLCLMTGCRDPIRPSAAVQIAVPAAVRGIKPGYSLTYGEGQVNGLVFESMVERDRFGNAIPWLAKRWVSPDSQTWTFTLQSGVRFHDGTPLRAVDVVRSWTTLVADSTDGDEPPGVLMLVRGAAAVRARTATVIDGLRVLDDTTLVVELLQREPGLARTLGSRRLGVMGAASGPWSPVGTGPWRLAAAVPTDSTLRFGRNERYWHGRAGSDSLVVRVVPTKRLAAAFAEGLVDCANDLSDDEAAGLAVSRALRLIPSPALTRVRILLNFGNPALRDVRVRRALLMALDRAAIARAGGLIGAVLSDAAVPPFLLPDSTTPLTPYHPDSARRLLVAAGYSKGRPVVLRTPFDPNGLLRPGLARVLTDYWNAIGVRTEATGARGDDSPRVRPPSDLEVWIEEPGISTPEEYLNLIGVEGPYGFFAPTLHWQSPGFRSLYRTARTTRHPAVRDTAVRAMTRLVSDSVPSLPLFFTGSLSAESLRVSDCDETMPRYGTTTVTR